MRIYPLLKITLLFITGLVLGKFLSLSPGTSLYLVGGSLAGLLLLYFIQKFFHSPVFRYIFLFGAGLFIISTGILRYSSAVRPMPDDISHFISSRPVRVTGIIRGDPLFRRHGVRFELRCEKLNRDKKDLPITGRLQVLFHGQVKEVEPILQCGNRIEITGKISLPRDRGNPGEISKRERLAARSIHGISRIYRTGDITLMEKAGAGSLCCLAINLKHQLQKIIQESLPNPRNHPGSLQSTMLEALMLGERSAIPYEIKDKFRAVGVIHVLVVSGLHVSFIWILGLFIFSPFPLRIRHALLIPLVVGYVLITGASTAAVRAGVMACVYSLAFVLNQPRNPLTAIAAAGLGLLLYNPAKLRPFIGVPLAAQLGALPLVAYYFHSISLIALPANILIVLLVAGIVCLGFIASLTGLIAVPIAWLINYPNRFLILLLLKLVGWFSRFPGAGVRIASFPVAWIFIWYLIILSPAYLRPRRRKVLWIIGTSAILLLIGWGVLYLPVPDLPPFKAIFFNTESGEQTLLREADGPIILITSDDDRFGDIRSTISPYLFQEKIDNIDYLILTQANLDHLNVLNRLLETVTIGTVLDHPLGPSSPSYPRLREILEENGINYRRLTHDDLIVIGGSSISILWPRCRSGTKFQTDYSLVIKLRFGEISFLFTSRIGIIAQEDLAENPIDLKATVLKAPWRGSSAHISPFFLKAIKPEYGLLIQGRKYFGRYPRDCGDFLKQEGAEVHKTGEEGCLIVETDGRSCRVLSTLNRELYK